ncbi:MAG: tetratricopeptide repeat protein, partial [Elusimicrobiota bacterium]
PIQPVLKPRAILTTLTKAEAALEERRYSEAIELAMQALREDENSLDAWQILGTAYFALQDHENALDAWRKVLNLEKSPTVRETIKRHIRSIERMAGRRRGEGMKPPEPKPATAVPAPVQRPKLSSGEIQSLYQRGIEAYTGGDSTGAKEAFEAIIEADPMNVEAQKALKRIRDEERGQ